MTRQARKRLMDRKIVELFLQGKSSREVMGALRVGDRRVKKIRYLAEEYGYLNRDPLVALPPYPEALFPDGPDGRANKTSEANSLILARKEWIVERIEAGWHPITVFEELGLPIGRSSFYRFLHRHSLVETVDLLRRRVVPEIIHNPGEALLLDWGKLRDVIDPETKKKKTLWAFVGVLGYSRYLMVRLVWTNETKITLRAIESMFQEIGGVPSRLTSDNPKCFSLEASNYEPLLNPSFERFANHYGTRIECLPPADPEKKGKVERMMSYVRRLYEAHGNEWSGTEESQNYINKKLVLANERIHGTTRVKPIEQLLNIEVGQLKALPSLAYEIEDIAEGTVRRDGHVRFNHKYYSLEERFIGSEVFIIANQMTVSIYHDGKLLEVHNRIPATDALRSKSTKSHHRKPWERELENGSQYRMRAGKIGPDVENLIVEILKTGEGFLDTRKIWGILSLDKTYESEQINKACRQALELGTYSYRAVRSLLRLLPKNPNQNINIKADPLKTIERSDHKFVRPMSVYEEQLNLLH